MNLPPYLPDEMVPRPALVDWNALRRAMTRYSVVEGAALGSVLVWIVLVSAVASLVRPTGPQFAVDRGWTLFVAALSFAVIVGFHQCTFRLLTRPAAPYKSREDVAASYRSLTLWGGLTWLLLVSAVLALNAQAAPPFTFPSLLLALWLTIAIPPLLIGMVSIHELRFRLGLAPVRQMESSLDDEPAVEAVPHDWPMLWRKVRRRTWRNALLAAAIFAFARGAGIALDAAADDVSPNAGAIFPIVLFTGFIVVLHVLWSEWAIRRTRRDIEDKHPFSLTRERVSHYAYKHLRETALLLAWLAVLIVIGLVPLLPPESSAVFGEARDDVSLFFIVLAFNPLPGRIRQVLGLPPLRLARSQPEKRKRGDGHSGSA